MSKTKSPTEKKRLSLERDRRNMSGENDKASRKLIPRRKQLDRMGQRRQISQILAPVKGNVDEETCDSVESQVQVKTIKARRKSFRKRPDIPLGEVLTTTGKRSAIS
jgi:hypothetical protein